MEAVELRDAGVRFRLTRRNRRTAPHAERDVWGLRGASVCIRRGERVGIVGANGAGKSTLLGLVAGVYDADEGSVVVRGRVGPVLSSGASLRWGLDGRANIELSLVLLGLSQEEARARAVAVAEFTGLGRFLDAPVSSYSAGMKARLGFAAVAHCDPDVLLLDEVMSVGDEDLRERSEQRIQELVAGGCTVIATSHELDKLVRFATRVVWLDAGRIVDDGEPGAVVEAYVRAHRGPRARGRATPGLG